MVFECTTTGGVATVWQGSIFNCERMANSISLRHSQFSHIETVVGVCNDGAVIARGVSLYGNNYTSQLNITINESMLGQTIQCAHDDGRHVNVVGQKTIMNDKGTVIVIECTWSERLMSLKSLSTASLNLSGYVHVSDVRPNMITFTWGPAVNMCPFLQYHIETNCGICLENTTADTTITCSRIIMSTIDSNTNDCSFAVHASTMCGTNKTVIGTDSSISLRLNGRTNQ